MHQLAKGMTKLCHNWKRDNAGGKSISIYYSSRRKAVLIVNW